MMEDLPSETLIIILKNLNINDLLSTSQVSKFFYSLSSDDRLWRDLFLQRFGHCSIMDNEKELNKLKDDLIRQSELYHSNTHNNNNNNSNSNSPLNKSPSSSILSTSNDSINIINNNNSNSLHSSNNNNNSSSSNSSNNSNGNQIEETHDDFISKIYQRVNHYQVKVLLGYQRRVNGGWKGYYRRHVLLLLSKELIDSLYNDDNKLTEHLLSIKLLKYNNTYSTAAELATRNNQTEYLEKILKYFPIDGTLKDFYLHSYMRLITKSVQKNSIACAKLLLNHGADITYSNTGVLLMGSKIRTFNLNGEFGNKVFGTFQRLCPNNIELSYYFLDALLSQIIFFICVHSGNEMTLQEYVKSNRALVFSNKRTGIWDCGFEVLRFSGLFGEYNYNQFASYRYKRLASNNSTPILNGINNNNQNNVNNNSSSSNNVNNNHHVNNSNNNNNHQQHNNNNNDHDNNNNSSSINEYINHNHHSSIGSTDSNDEILSLENMTKIKFSQFKMIEKTLSQITVDWSSEYCSYTPLHWSAKGGHINNIRTLIKMGADIHALTSSGKTVLDIAKENNRDNCIPYLESQMLKLINLEKFESLFKLIKEGDVIGSIKFISTFLSEKQIKYIEKSIISKLIIYSIQCNQPKIMSALLPCCSSREDVDGNSPIHYSAALGRLECLEMAIMNGHDINKVNKCYQTPLIFATMNGHVHLVEYLLEMGSRVDVPDWQLNTALHYSSPYPEIVKLLLEYNADPLQINYLYKNSIHCAVELSSPLASPSSSLSLPSSSSSSSSSSTLDSINNRCESLKLILNSILVVDKNQINNPDIFGNTPLILTQYHNYLNDSNNDSSNNNDEMSNIILNELKKNQLSTITSKTNTLNLSFDDFNLISKKTPTELEEYLSTTNPLKPTVAMLAISKLDGNISLETFDRLKLQHHLMLESYFKKLKFLNCYSQMAHVFNNNLESIKSILNIISQYQLKSFSYDSWEKIFKNYLTINRFEIPTFILSNLNNYMNSTTYIDRFQVFIINSLLHSPSIPEKYCRSLLSPYRTRLDPSTYQRAISYDHVIMLKSMIIRDEIDDGNDNSSGNNNNNNINDDIGNEIVTSQEYSDYLLKSFEFFHLPLPIYWIFSRVVKNGAIKCCRFLSSILFKKSLDPDYTHSILINSIELRGIKNRSNIINILSHYDSNSIIKALQDNPSSPNGNAFTDSYRNQTSTSSSVPIEIDYHQFSELHPTDPSEKFTCEYCGIKDIIDLQDHLSICLNANYSCPNKINGCCEEPMSKSKLLNHLNKYCQYLHCSQCDLMFNRTDFVDHLFTHDSDTWEVCSLCNQMLKGFSSNYKSDIIHVRDYNNNNNNNNNGSGSGSGSGSNQNQHNNNGSSKQNQHLLSSEYQHLKHCKNHFIKCHSCKITIHISELKDHKCLVISKLPIFRNLLNIQNNNLIDLI